MRLFLDASVLLAPAGSPNGSSHAVFSSAAVQRRVLVSSPHALNEVLRNLPEAAASRDDRMAAVASTGDRGG